MSDLCSMCVIWCATLIMVQWYHMVTWDWGQHWIRKCLVAWRHQAITWTDVDLLHRFWTAVHVNWLQQIKEILLNTISEYVEYYLFLFIFSLNVVQNKCTLLMCDISPSKQNNLWGSVASPEGNFREFPKLLFCLKSLRIILFKFLPHLPGVNNLTHFPLVLHICISESGQHWFR